MYAGSAGAACGPTAPSETLRCGSKRLADARPSYRSVGWLERGRHPVPTAMAATSSRAYLLLRYRACTQGPLPLHRLR